MSNLSKLSEIKIFYGTMSSSEENIAKALELGFAAIDSAYVYSHIQTSETNPSIGNFIYAESLVGKALEAFIKNNHSRNEIFMQTKFFDHKTPENQTAIETTIRE